LRDGQDDAIGFLRRSLVVMVVVVVMCAVSVIERLDVSGVMLGGRRELLEEMVHPMRCGCGEKKNKGGANAQV
jgi:hypothetical protein